MCKRLVIIPARLGSKRIVNKNIKKFIDKPIIVKVIDELKKSCLFNEIHISTESNYIKRIVEDHVEKIRFLRPKYLSNDSAIIIDVIDHVIKKYNQLRLYFEEIWLVLPTSVLLTSKDFIQISKKYKTEKIINMIGVAKFSAPVEWAMNINNNFLSFKNKKFSNQSSHLFKDSFYDTGTFAIYKNLSKDKIIINSKKKFSPYILPQYKSVDIDTIEDWELAKKYYKFNKK